MQSGGGGGGNGGGSGGAVEVGGGGGRDGLEATAVSRQREVVRACAAFFAEEGELQRLLAAVAAVNAQLPKVRACVLCCGVRVRVLVCMRAYVRMCVRACVRVCVRACVRACVRVCIRASVCVRARARVCVRVCAFFESTHSCVRAHAHASTAHFGTVDHRALRLRRTHGTAAQAVRNGNARYLAVCSVLEGR